jgi:Fe2+ or Zn2+ uptake regulation protein
VLSHLALVEPPHAHAVCRQCGRILEVPLGALDIAQLTSLAGAAAEEWSVERISLSLNGLCPRCRHGALPPSLGPRE